MAETKREAPPEWALKAAQLIRDKGWLRCGDDKGVGGLIWQAVRAESVAPAPPISAEPRPQFREWLKQHLNEDDPEEIWNAGWQAAATGLSGETPAPPMTAEQFWRTRYGVAEDRTILRSDNDPLVSIWEFAEAYAAGGLFRLRAECDGLRDALREGIKLQDAKESCVDRLYWAERAKKLLGHHRWGTIKNKSEAESALAPLPAKVDNG